MIFGVIVGVALLVVVTRCLAETPAIGMYIRLLRSAFVMDIGELVVLVQAIR